MLNLAQIRVVAIAFGASCLSSACAVSSPAQGQPSTVEGRIGPLKLLAESDYGLLNLTVAERGVYVAEVARNGERWTAASASCAPLREALDLYRNLPPIRPGPITLMGLDQPTRPPSCPHCTWWRWQVQGWTSDGYPLQMQLQGNQGPYPAWFTATVDALAACKN